MDLRTAWLPALALLTLLVAAAAAAAHVTDDAPAGPDPPAPEHGDLGTLEALTEERVRAHLAAEADLDDVTLAWEGIREGKALDHARLVQTEDGLPVEGTRAQVSVDGDGAVRWRLVDVRPGVEASPCPGFREEAVDRARQEIPGELWVEPDADHLVNHHGETVWRVNLLPKEPVGSWMVEVACDGEVLRSWDAARRAEGQGTVYRLSPIVAAEDPDLRDDPSGSSALVDAPTTEVTLMGLDGSGTLSGEYAYMVTPAAVEADGEFHYDRGDPRFEEVHAYYYTDWAQRHIQFLGFDDVHNRTTATVPRLPGGYTAFYTGNPDAEIFYGYKGAPATLLYGPEHVTAGAPTGLADAAEDAHVIFHEYGHAVLDDQAGICCTDDTGALHEGFADWQSASMSTRFFEDPSVSGCMAPWFGSYLQPEPNGTWPCYRSVDNDLTMDDWEEGDDPHFNQLVWSGALWEIETALMGERGRADGAAAFEELMYESNFLLPKRPTVEDAALALLEADAVAADGAFHDRIAETFADRKILPREEIPSVAELGGEAAQTGDELTPTDEGGAGDQAIPGPGAALAASAALAAAALRRRR